MSALERWNESLLEVLLPAGVNQGAPVVIACDDESVRLAGELLALAEDQALEDLLAACRSSYGISAARGVSGVAHVASGFASQSRPRAEPPPWLALLSLCVLAASRMDRDGGRVTQDYYGRLLELLALPAADGHPPVVGFERCRALWFELAEWLREDERGARGLLVLPGHGHRHVGLPVSQTLFRRRDRVLLSAFFARQRANIEAGWDMLTQLRQWDRQQLTSHAREVVHDHELEPLVRGALRTAYASWDGSSSDDSGRRLWPGRLRLAAGPSRLSLAVSCERYSEDVELDGPEGTLDLPGFPIELTIPLGWLDRLATGRLILPVRGRNEAVVLPSGQTLLFEAGEQGGLLHSAAADREPVWVLSRDPHFQKPGFDEHRYTAALLPAGWTLLAALNPALLPEQFRRHGRADKADITLEGGLRLGQHVYLGGFPPLVRAGAIDGEVPVRLDGSDVGTLKPFGELALDGLALGPHTLEAGPARFELELVRRGRREGVGELRWDIGDQPLYRNGAAPSGRGGRPARGPFVCGVLLDGLERPARPAPLLLRTNALVFAVYANGDVQGHARPQPAGWMRSVGLPDGAARWRVPGGERVEWLLLSGASPRVLRVGNASVVASGALADLVGRFRDAPVKALHERRAEQEVAREWAALCQSCEEFGGEPV